MSEIEKLYENAGIKPRKIGYCDWDCDCPYPEDECGDECPYWKYEDKATLPSFTAEKQIELIKWLAKRPLTLLIGRYKGKYYFGNSNFHSKADSFDNAIAIRINDLWQDLTDVEKEQIRDILKG